MDECPSCKADLRGENIWHYFYNRLITDGYYKGENPRTPEAAEAEATEIASYYGATKEKGHFGKAIGIYSMGQDRTVAYQCPVCKYREPR